MRNIAIGFVVVCLAARVGAAQTTLPAPAPDEADAVRQLQQIGVNWFRRDEQGRVTEIYWGSKDGRNPETGLPLLRSFPALRDLNMEVSHTTDVGLVEVGKLTSLESLDLYECKITGKGLAELARLKNLKHLGLAECQLTDADLAGLPALPQLEELNLSGNALADAGMASVAQFTSLQSLEIAQTLSYTSKMQIGDAGLARLAALKALRHLDLNNARVTDAGLASLSSLKLQFLNLGGAEITDQGMADLAKIQTLQSLLLNFTSVTDAGLAELKSLTALQRLELQSNQITDAGLAQLKAFSHLTHLSLRLDQAHFTGAGLANLRALPDFKRLDLFSGAPSSAGVADLTALPGLPALEVLWLDNTAVTSANIAELTKLTHVKEIVFGPGTSVSPDDLEELERNLPSVMISYGSGKSFGTPINLPPEQATRRAALLAKADAEIRAGLQTLAKTYPQLAKARQWSRIERPSAAGRIGLSLFYPDRGKGGAEKDLVVPEAERLSILVVIQPPQSSQLAMSPLYPHLGLGHQINLTAGDAALQTAVKTLVSQALAPLAQWEQELAARDPSKP